MKFFLFSILAIYLVTTVSVQASESTFTPFESGTPATAESVNTALQGLVDAINDNNNRLAALESNAGSNDVAGKTYHLKQIGVILRGNGDGGATVGNLNQRYTLAIGTDNTFSLNGFENEGEVSTETGTTFHHQDDDAVTATGTYTQVNDDVTLIFPDEGTVPFVVAADGSVLIFADFEFGPEDDMPSWTRSESSLVIGVETTQ